jgi:outer membrane receptor protein involved in Fe transport
MGALIAPNVWAQDVKPADAATTETAGKETKDAKAQQSLDVVTVTATRRREPLRDVPLRVETLKVDALERSGAGSLADYVGTLPGIDVSSDGGPGRSQVSIRGVSIGAGGTPTVGTYIDDVAFGSSTIFGAEAAAALDMSLLDLHHIEVLRGPQGTLYGAGAMGGLLKYVTNEPDSYAFSGKVGLGLRQVRGGALGHTENAVVNVPLSEGVAAMRVAAFNDHDGGYTKTSGRVAGEHADDGNTRGARVSVLVDPTSQLKLRLTGTEQHIKRNGTALVQYDAATGAPIYGDLTHKLDTAEPYRIKNRLLSSDVEYDFGGARLNVILSSQRIDNNTVLDATDVVGSPAFNFAELDNRAWLRKNTQELRLTSARGTIEWLLGGYHSREKGSREQRLWAELAADASVMDLVSVNQPATYDEKALYGDVTYNPTSALSFTLGARTARIKQTYETLTNGNPDFPAPLNSSDKANTYLLTGRYSLDGTSSVYLRAASGYRPGGPNPPAIDQNGQVVPGAPTSFQPDTLWSYEAGYKADLLDKRLGIEVAVFDIRWDKLQQPIPVGATTVTGNASKAEIKGLELASRYVLDSQWSLEGSLAWSDAKLKEDAPELGPAGSRLPNSARLAYSIGGRFGYSLAGNPSYVSLSARHVGQRNAGFEMTGSAVPNYSLPAYTLVDAQWGMDFGAWQVSAFVRNLTDKRALLGGDAALTAFGGPLRATVAQPRTFGTTLTYNF